MTILKNIDEKQKDEDKFEGMVGKHSAIYPGGCDKYNFCPFNQKNICFEAIIEDDEVVGLKTCKLWLHDDDVSQGYCGFLYSIFRDI